MSCPLSRTVFVILRATRTPPDWRGEEEDQQTRMEKKEEEEEESPPALPSPPPPFSSEEFAPPASICVTAVSDAFVRTRGREKCVVRRTRGRKKNFFFFVFSACLDSKKRTCAKKKE